MTRHVPVFKAVKPRPVIPLDLKLGPGHPAWNFALSQFAAEGIASGDALFFANASEPGERPWLDEMVERWGLQP